MDYGGTIGQNTEQVALTTGAQLDRVLAPHRTGGIDRGGTALTMEAQLDRVLLTTEARH